MEPLTIDGYITELQEILCAYKDDWNLYLHHFPRVKYSTLYGFAMNHKRFDNPRLDTLRQAERLCRMLCPQAFDLKNEE